MVAKSGASSLGEAQASAQQSNSSQTKANFPLPTTVTIYAPELFEIVSGKGTDSSLFTTAIFGVVKFVAALVSGLVILDLFGRKCAAFIGITLQTIASLYIASFLTKYNPDVIGTVASSAGEKRASEAAIAMIFISGVGWVTGFK